MCGCVDVLVGVYGFSSVWVCVSVGFVVCTSVCYVCVGVCMCMCGCVYVYVWVCICVGFVMCWCVYVWVL